MHIYFGICMFLLCITVLNKHKYIFVFVYTYIHKQKHMLLDKISVLTCFPLVFIKSVCPIDIDISLHTDNG